MSDPVASFRAQLDEDERRGQGDAHYSNIDAVAEYGARMVREVEAKRRLLAMHEDAVRRVKNPPSAEARQAARVEQFVLEEVFRALAFPDEQPPPAEEERP